MNNALIGFTGFVGGTLLNQCSFENLYRSTNIHEIEGKKFDVVVCAGAPAQKWIANQNPNDDLRVINKLIDHLSTIECKTFILISTVDVFSEPINVNERSIIVEEGLHPYGLNRRLLEKFVETTYTNHLIVRLPGLVGSGLRKNVIFDFLNNNNLSAIDSRGVFQFYPMANLWYDIQTALSANLKLVHLCTEPISVADLALSGFSQKFDQKINTIPALYNVKTCYANLFNADGDYQYSRREMIQAIRTYAQSEPLSK